MGFEGTKQDYPTETPNRKGFTPTSGYYFYSAADQQGKITITKRKTSANSSKNRMNKVNTSY